MNPQQAAAHVLKNELAIKRAFVDYVRAILGNVTAASVERHITQGRIDAIMDSLGIDAQDFADMTEAIRTAYVDGGKLEARDMPALRRPDGVKVRLRFDVRNLRAEAWLREHSARLVQNIVSEQRLAIRQVVEEGMRLGRNPRQVALDITGPVSQQTGRRTGGIVGLNEQQARYVTNAREQLLSNDTAKLREYLARVRRDARFDKTVLKSIQTGKPLTSAQVDKITQRYADRLLQLRGETIARTEALTSLAAAREETFRQAMEAGDLDAQDVKKTWKTAADSRVRHIHADMSGQVRGINEPFNSPTGAMLMFPGDSSMGANGEDTINCRCYLAYRIDFIGQARRRNG